MTILLIKFRQLVQAGFSVAFNATGNGKCSIEMELKGDRIAHPIDPEKWDNGAVWTTLDDMARTLSSRNPNT